MPRLIGLIPAAGKGTRAYPYTHEVPKGMLPINGRPNIEHLIRRMRDQLRIREIYVVTGHLGPVIRDYCRDGSQWGVAITYLENTAIQRGWAHSVLLGREHIRDHFCVMLSDECYVGTNHDALLDSGYQDALAVCAVTPVDDRRRIRKNYAVEVDKGRITRLVENPRDLTNNLLGLGTFILSPRIFNIIARAYDDAPPGEVDLISLLGRACGAGEVIKPFVINGHYVNINDRDSLQLAKYYVRRELGAKASTGVLIYSEGGEPDLPFTLDQYLALRHLSEVLVVLPNGASTRKIERKDPRLTLLNCPPGVDLYGEKIKYGLDRLSADILAITEASYSFHRRDLAKLEAYIREADMVIGTRTTRQLIEQGASMRGVVRWANMLLAKLLEQLWRPMDCRFTDVGCTFRALWRTSYLRIRDHLSAPGPEFSVQMITELLRAREHIIEIPVSYYGRSYAMYGKYQNVRTFRRMLKAILDSRTRRPR